MTDATNTINKEKKRLHDLYEGISFLCLSDELTVHFASAEFAELSDCSKEPMPLSACNALKEHEPLIREKIAELEDEKLHTFFKLTVNGEEKLCHITKGLAGRTRYVLCLSESEANLFDTFSTIIDFISSIMGTSSFADFMLPTVITNNGIIYYCNDAFTEATGYRLRQLYGMKLSKIAIGDSKGIVEQIENGDYISQALYASFLTQREENFNAWIHTTHFNSGAGLLHILYDRKQELHNSRLLDMFSSVADCIDEGVCIFDSQTYEPFWINQAFETLTGYDIEHIKPVFDYLRKFESEFESHISDHEYWYKMDTISTSYGAEFCAEMHIHKLRGKYMCLCIENSNEKLQAAQILNSFKTTDYLTGLDNAISFRKVLQEEYDKCATQPDCISLAMFSVENYNDLVFHVSPTAADEILKLTALRAKTFAKNKEGYISRLGEYRFAMLFRTNGDEQSYDIMDEFMQYMDVPVVYDGINYHLKINAGVCTYPGFASEMSTLYSTTTSLLNSAILNNKSGYACLSQEVDVFFTPYISTFEAEMDSSIDNDDFTVRYLPIYDREDANKVVAIEAFMRTKSERIQNAVSASFMGEVNTSGAIIQIGYKVIENIIAHLASWLSESKKIIPVYINLSSIQLSDENLGSFIANTLAKYRVPCRFIRLQVHFDEVKYNPVETIQKLVKLRTHGLSPSVAYFNGSSQFLEKLCSMGLSCLKIEKSFLSDEAEKEKMLKLIDIARKYSVEIYISGIETIDQLNSAKKCNVDCMQGYLFSTPVSIEFLGEMIK